MASSLPSAIVLLLLLFFSAIISVVSSSNHHHFEGFDSDELDPTTDEDDELDNNLLPQSSPPTTMTTSTFSSDQQQQQEQQQKQQQEASSPSIHKPQTPPSLDLYWDEDEFEGIPVISTPDHQSDRDINPSLDIQSPVSDNDQQEKIASSSPAEPKSIKSYTIEIVCISFLISFVINFFTGRKQNENIALSWASRFAAAEDSIFVKNFSLLGTGDGKDTPLLLKEGQDVFKFYASGRRFCQGLLASMELRARHDLISRAMDLVFARKDMITFEVVLNEDSMDHVVMAVARKKMAKAMQKEMKDLQRFAVVVTAPPTGRKWVADDLLVVTESKEVAGDLITEAVLDQVLGEKSFEKFGKWFISMHFSDQHAGSHKKVLVFKFVLPDANNMAELTRLVALVPYYIDLIGRYKLSSQARSKTEAARAKAAQEAYKELQNARQETLQKRKTEKKKLFEDAETKLSAEALRKKEEKERARQLKKSMPRVKMLRGH